MSDHSSSDEESIVSTESLPQASAKAKGKRKAGDIDADDKRFIVQTAFDSYFLNASSRSQTSANVFSNLLAPLSAEEYADAIGSAHFFAEVQSCLVTSKAARDDLFSRMLLELQEGFNILCYGYGSKRTLLNQFATECCAKKGHVVVANAFRPHFTLKEALASIERVPGIAEWPLDSSTVEGQTARAVRFFSETGQRHLYLVLHNIDASAMRTPRARSCIANLAACPGIHLTASIDHINAPLLWTSAEASARKASALDKASNVAVGAHGFNWLWHDATTLLPYDAELAHVDRSSLSAAHGGGPAKGGRRGADAGPAAAGTMVSETAAQHVLASVTAKAKRLFAMIATRQLESIAAGAEGEEGGTTNLQAHAIPYDVLFAAARDKFIATNDTALRALLGEFRDHGLVVGEGALWIPMRRERLANVLKTLPEEA
ncbi:origin recognition complex, subunit 2 [Schizophyllum amplum]|uniref:Origin recognition complex subunit 2 n=1 Tax=Schizophyllum amplum TaxID=97359 RepID=A0A550BY51_9AGAR|nr:origin recognition complex, subunit 2 [Auriculariopsis ampla]